MKKMITACLAALCLASVAVAAPKEAAKGEKPCPAGVGKAVCCKGSVADHCGYVSCCEQGNRAFFSSTDCSTCGKHTAKAQKAAQKASPKAAACGAEGNLYVSSCEQGNGGFFKRTAGTKSACCAGEAKKKK